MVWLRRLGAGLGLAVAGAFVIWIVGSLALILMEWLGGIIPGHLILGVAVGLFIVLVSIDWAVDERQKRQAERWNRDNL